MTKLSDLTGGGGGLPIHFMNDMYTFMAEQEFANTLQELGYPNGMFDIFRDESKIASSSQVVITDLANDADADGRGELSASAYKGNIQSTTKDLGFTPSTIILSSEYEGIVDPTVIEDFSNISDWTGDTGSFSVDAGEGKLTAVNADNTVNLDFIDFDDLIQFTVKTDTDTGNASDEFSIDLKYPSGNSMGKLLFRDSDKNVIWYDGINEYIIYDSSSDTVSRPDDNNSSGTISTRCGLKIHANTTVSNIVITESSNVSGHTKAYLTDISGSVLASSPISNGEAFLRYTLESGTDYYIVTDAEGSNYTRGFQISNSYPISGLDLDITAGVWGSTNENTDGYNILSIESYTPISWAIDTEYKIAMTPNFTAETVDVMIDYVLQGSGVNMDTTNTVSVTIDDFEDGNVSGWTGDTTNLTADNSTIISGSYSAKLTSTNEYANVQPPTNSDVIKSMEIKVRIGSDTGDTGVDDELRLKLWSDSNTIGRLMFRDGSNDLMWDGGTDNILASNFWSPNTNYTVKFVFDFSAFTVDIFIDGVQKGTTQSMKNNENNYQYVDIWNITYGSGITRDIWFDNYKLRKIEPIVSNISAISLNNLTTNSGLTRNVWMDDLEKSTEVDIWYVVSDDNGNSVEVKRSNLDNEVDLSSLTSSVVDITAELRSNGGSGTVTLYSYAAYFQE